MNWFIHRMLGHFMMEGEPGQGGGGEPPAAPPVTAPPATSVLGAAQTQTDFIPEKYRTVKEDGSLDLEASARKTAEAYKNLETRFGSGDVPPKTIDEYAPELKVEGVTWDEFKADPQGQEFIKGAHALGLTNQQLAYVVDAFHNAVPGLVEGNAALTTQDCMTALKSVWTDDQAVKANLSSSYRAAEAFANADGQPGSFSNLMAKYGNDPDFIAFTANIGKELREDTAINGGGVNEGDFNVKADDLRKQIETLPAHDPKLPGLRQQLNDMYSARYNKNSRLK
jgi:hypothetical protein